MTAFDIESGGKELAVYWVANDEGLPAEELRAFSAAVVARLHDSDGVHSSRLIPLSPNGKIDYKALPAPVRQRDQDVSS